MPGLKGVNWRKAIGWLLLAWGLLGTGAEVAVLLFARTVSIGLAVFSFSLCCLYLFIGQHLLRKKPS